MIGVEEGGAEESRADEQVGVVLPTVLEDQRQGPDDRFYFIFNRHKEIEFFPKNFADFMSVFLKINFTSKYLFSRIF